MSAVPLAKPGCPGRPGRVRVFQAVEKYMPEKVVNFKQILFFKDDELTIAEGDLIYVNESPLVNQTSYYKAKNGEQSGLLPESYINGDSVQKIDFPLHEAAKRGNFEFLQECLKNNVSVNGLDKSGSTALYWAAHGGHFSLVEYLLSVPNISIAAQNKLGDTALHAASWKGRLQCVQLLVEAGANPHIKNKDGKKAVDLAGNPEIGSLLRITMSSCVENPEEYLNESSEDSDSCT